MQHGRSEFALTLPPNADTRPDARAFVPLPAFLTAGWSWQQQMIYRQAWLQAQASLSGVRSLRVHLADLPKVLRN